MPGYHINNIPKGEVGEFNKIEEEFAELQDAHQQNSIAMEFIEMSDLIGAIEEYLKKYNMTLEDLKKFSDITKRAFKSGERK